MKQLFISLLLLMGSVAMTQAQQPSLQFNKNGKFKIVQFTDVHYIYGNPKSDIAIKRMNEVLDAEKPDLVIVTGDIIFGKPAKEGMTTVLNVISKRKIPFGVTFGNHDDEHDMTRRELYDLVRTIPYNLNSTAEGISGVTNYTLPIKSANNTQKDAALLYCFDSNAYSQIEGVKGYDYIKFDQIGWYREQSKQYTAKNGGKPMNALAFFHIPLPEYIEASTQDTAKFIGIRKEKACPPDINSGLFTSMLEMGDVQGVFVGHEHDNDYAVYWKGIVLAYGRYTGGDTVYNNLTNGARVIELTEGEEGFRTWIRLKDGEILHKIKAPDFFTNKK